MTITKVLVPSGVLGLGFDIEALKHGIKNKPDIISPVESTPPKRPVSHSPLSYLFTSFAYVFKFQGLQVCMEVNISRN